MPSPEASTTKKPRKQHVPRGNPNIESSIQIAAFERWFELGRDSAAIDKVSRELSVVDRTLYRWLIKWDWVGRGSKRLEEARKKAEPDRVAQIAKLIKDEYKGGELLRLKSIEKLSAKQLDRSSDAINAMVKGLNLVRRSLGLPMDYGEQKLDVNLTGDVKMEISEAALISALERILDDMDKEEQEDKIDGTDEIGQ